MAPVKAPRSWPKSSDSSRPEGMAAQLILTKVRSRRGLRLWMARAKSSLPVPVSPRSSTVVPAGAASSTCERARFRAEHADHLVRVTVEFSAANKKRKAIGNGLPRRGGIPRNSGLSVEEALVAGKIESVDFEHAGSGVEKSEAGVVVMDDAIESGDDTAEEFGKLAAGDQNIVDIQEHAEA